MDRKGSAVWEGGLKGGNGRVSTVSGVLKDSQYSFSTRFENGVGTNPEELIGAAHAACFAMAFSAQMEARGLTGTRVEATSTVTIDKVEGGFGITQVHLDVTAHAPGDQSAVEEAAQAAKSGCPISKLLAAPITMELKVTSDV